MLRANDYLKNLIVEEFEGKLMNETLKFMIVFIVKETDEDYLNKYKNDEELLYALKLIKKTQ